MPKESRKFFFDTEFIEDGKTIDPISIGIVAEDGSEYYAIFSDFDESKASDFVKTEVLPHLEPHITRKPKHVIAKEILEFVSSKTNIPEFYAYYAAYDWILLCQLYGTMMDLPKGWPMYCLDIKQIHHQLNKPRLPGQDGTVHNALDDARWNHKLYNYLSFINPL